VLLLLEFEKRTPAIHQYILSALDGVSADDAATTFSPELHGTIGQFASKDDQIAKHYALMLGRCVSTLAKGGHLTQAHGLLTKAQSVDASVRASFQGSAELLAAQLFDAGELVRAEQVLALFAPNPSFLIRVRWWFASVGLAPRFALLLGVTAIVVVLAVSRRRRANAVAADERKADAIRKSASAMQPPPVEEQAPRYSPEYIEALKVFGLGVDATLSDVKNAYRQAVKEHHPDAKPNPTAADNDYFISLTTAYERLVKLQEREGRSS
jgi:hypothetical protein